MSTILTQPIAITGSSAISSIGEGEQAYSDAVAYISYDLSLDAWVGKLPQALKEEIDQIRIAHKNYNELDPSVLYALYTARKAVAQAGWERGSDFGVNVGSSRGATQLFEKYHLAFAKKKQTHPLASPTTTLGNLSSWVAQDLLSVGPDISHSITCSTALHGVLNATAWLQSGLCDRFLVGGSEAALTPFTIAQMKAMKTYSRASQEATYACEALNLDKVENTMVLGEGASSICLEKGTRPQALAYITGVGYATEALKHAASISAEATCFQKSMRMALNNHDIQDIDAIVMHAPGTIAGDKTEFLAIKKLFGENVPLLTTNKWKIGHTFGASGLLSLDMGLYMLQSDTLPQVPFISKQEKRKPLRKILINAVGFGGNAVSILLSKAS